VRRRAHDAAGLLVQAARRIGAPGRVDQRFVALHVDDAFVVGQAQQLAGLGQPVAAAGVVAARQHGGHTMGGAGGQDAWSSQATTTRAAPLSAARSATRTTIGLPAMSASGLSGRRLDASRAGTRTTKLTAP
jgi:O-acetyl-ADP-ribose deacetylase (regulator of RNase III)